MIDDVELIEEIMAPVPVNSGIRWDEGLTEGNLESYRVSILKYEDNEGTIKYKFSIAFKPESTDEPTGINRMSVDDVPSVSAVVSVFRVFSSETVYHKHPDGSIDESTSEEDVTRIVENDRADVSTKL
jgi:hypothetical protein